MAEKKSTLIVRTDAVLAKSGTEQNPMSFLPAVKWRPQRYIDVFSEAEVDDLVALPLIDSVLMLALVGRGPAQVGGVRAPGAAPEGRHGRACRRRR